MTHTPTPWYLEVHDTSLLDNDLQNITIRLTTGPEYDWIFDLIGHRGDEIDKANAKRIVACVNACAPFEDPLASIPRMLIENEAQTRAINEALAEIDDKLKEQNYSPNEWVNDYCVGLLRAKEILTNKLK